MKHRNSTDEWHNPDPNSLGEIIEEKLSKNKKHKSMIIKNKMGNFTVYLYLLDDSDVLEGFSKTAGWVGVIGPSITDTLDKAKKLANEYLDQKQNDNE